MRKHDPYRLVILGGFGFDNLGDDLILRSALSQFRKVLGTVEITVLSNNPCETAARHRGEVVLFSPEALLRQIILRVLSRVSSYHRRYLLPLPGDHFRRLLVSLWKSDLVVSLGGGYLNDYSKFLTHSRLAELLFIGLCKKRLFLYGHEIGPLNRLTLRTLGGLAFKFVSYATVRDERSACVLLGLGFLKERLSFTADEAWAYEPQSAINLRPDMSEKKNGLVVAVNVISFRVLANVSRITSPERKDEQLLSQLSTWISSLTPGLRLMFFISMSKEDEALGHRLRELVRKQVPVEIVTDLNSQYSALAESHAAIAARMHPIIMAAQMSVPTLALGVTPKVSQTMKDVGLSDYTVPVSPLEAAALQDAFDRLTHNEETLRKLMKERLAPMRLRASLNAKLVLKILSSTWLQKEGKRRVSHP